MHVRSAVVCWLLCSGLAWGQSPPATAQPAKPAASEAAKPPVAEAPAEKAPPERPTVTPPRSIQESQPPLYYLKDKQGQLQAVPGFRFEDFVELYRLKSQLDQRERKPNYALLRMAASGTVQGDRAELLFQFTLRVEPGAWVRIPLRLDQAVLVEPAQAAKAAPLVQFEPDGDGYVCWIEGHAEQETVQLELKAFVPVLQLGDGARLKLFLPRAVASQLKLNVPGAAVEGKVSTGTVSSAPVAAEKDRTEFVIDGAAGDFELLWTAAGARPLQRPGEIECIGGVLVRAGGREIVSEATLTVRSHGAPFDRLRVRLPRDAELAAGEASGSGYRVVPVGQSGGERAVAEVQLPRKTAGPVEIRLTARRAYDPTKSGEWTDLSGFEVVEAARQWGHVAVATVGDWHVLWGPGRGVRQVDQWPEILRYEDVVAGFEYFVQPYSLSMRLVPRKSHVSVEPEYLVLVDAEQIRLEARWKYFIRGAKVFALEVKLGDWVFDQVEPENLVAVDGVALGANQMLSIPLQQPATGQLELTIRAHRPTAAGTKSIQFTLPQPVANTLGPAGVTVAPADNVELVPDTQALVGLSRQPQPAAPPLADRRQEPLFYRGEVYRANFAASFEVHARSLSAEVVSRVDLQPPIAQVEQRINYTIAYESLDRLTLGMPRGLASAEGFSVLFEGQPLVPVRLPEPAHKPGVQPPLISLAVALPRAYFGPCELLVRYNLPLGDVSATGSAVTVPLAMPGDTKLLGNKLSVLTAEGLTVQAAQSAWTPIAEDPLRVDASRGKQWAATEPLHQADLTLARLRRPLQTETVIERLWLQTWLSHSGRQERAAFRFVTQQKSLTLTMPDDAVTTQMPAFLDGQAVTLAAAGEGLWAVPLPADGAGRQHVLELQYHFQEAGLRRGSTRFAFPQLSSGVWVRRFYWQLVVPQYEHVLHAASTLTPEYVWEWDKHFWGRRPTLEQAELENWVGATHLPPVAATARCYVYSGMGYCDAAEVWIAARSWLVLLASGSVLVAGLFLLYVRICRHPIVLLASAALLLALAGQYPEPALLLGQAAVLGVALSAVAGVLKYSALRRRKGLPREVAQVVFEKASTQVQSPVAAGNHAPTQASPAAAASLEWDV